MFCPLNYADKLIPILLIILALIAVIAITLIFRKVDCVSELYNQAYEQQYSRYHYSSHYFYDVHAMCISLMQIYRKYLRKERKKLIFFEKISHASESKAIIVKFHKSQLDSMLCAKSLLPLVKFLKIFQFLFPTEKLH